MPIKVLHLIPTLSSGGAERQLVNIILSTSKDVVTHVVCVIGEAGFFAPELNDAGIRIVELKTFAKRPWFHAAHRFRKVVESEKPDIVNSWLYDASISARLARLPATIPIITSLQSAHYDPLMVKASGWSPAKNYGLKMIDRLTARFSGTYFVACSNFVQRSYQRELGIATNKIQTIYNAVDPASLEATEDSVKALRAELGLTNDAFVYLNIGRHDPPKNQRTLLESFRNVSKDVPSAYLVLVGTGPTEPDLKRLAESLGIAQRTLFLGRRSDIGTILGVADVFVFPSLLEGMPVALVEAMAKGLPCIASRIEVFNEVIEDRQTGLLVDPTSVAELSKTMTELYEKPELRKALGEQAYAHVSEKFRSSLTAKQWEALYQERIRNC